MDMLSAICVTSAVMNPGFTTPDENIAIFIAVPKLKYERGKEPPPIPLRRVKRLSKKYF